MLTVTHYIEFLSATAGPLDSTQRFQAYFIGETRILDGLTYLFSPFSIAGDVSSVGSENGELELIAPANIISTSLLWQASEGAYFVKVNAVLLSGTPPQDETGYPTWTELTTLTSTICACDSFGYADQVPGEEDQFAPVTLRLVNPLNFVTGVAPTRRLTAAQVGPLPSSGGITF